MVPFQKPGAPAAYGLSIAQCETAAWAVTPQRDRRPSAGAINAALAVAMGTRLPLRLYAVPGVKRVQDRTYSGIARNRRRLPGDKPYCRQRPDECR